MAQSHIEPRKQSNKINGEGGLENFEKGWGRGVNNIGSSSENSGVRNPLLTRLKVGLGW